MKTLGIAVAIVALMCGIAIAANKWPQQAQQIAVKRTTHGQTILPELRSKQDIRAHDNLISVIKGSIW